MIEALLVLAGSLIAGACGAFGAYAVSPARRARKLAGQAAASVEQGCQRVRSVLDAVSEDLAETARDYVSAIHDEWLRAVPVDEIRKHAPGVRLQPLEGYGVTNVAALQSWSFDRLRSVYGIGSVSARGIVDAAQAIAASVRQSPVPYPRMPLADPGEQRLADRTYRSLHAATSLGQLDRDLAAGAAEVATRAQSVRNETGFLAWALSAGRAPGIATAAADARALAADLEPGGRLGRLLSEASAAASREEEFARAPVPAATVSSHFERNAADYVALLEPHLGNSTRLARPARPAQPRGPAQGLQPPLLFAPLRRGPSVTGGLPDEIARQVEAYPIRLDGLRPDRHLRKYQVFGARYILAMEKTILGDAMGLGKTVEALAAMGHLRLAEGATHFLVVCPAGVVRNWAVEVWKFTTLPSRILHGLEREPAFDLWLREGGVAITSYDTFRTMGLERRIPPVALLVADEAHYVKNPAAARSQAVAAAIPRARRVCFMSGTPIENRVSEFRNLTSLLKPEVAQEIPVDDLGQALILPGAFQHVAARVYLRRNQEDVLHELPEKIEVEEWVDLEPLEQEGYRRAVLSRNLMAMRQAVTVSADGHRSSKMSRLAELLADYRQSGEKVVVFSFFHSVLEGIEKSFHTVGRIDGSIASEARLGLIAKLGNLEGHAVLLSQIEAGGVGLNIQAASVVVLMEPQWKPSTENQAIARVYRMGQTRRVIVHRLLARDSIDERLTDVLRKKQEIFDDHVRDSSVKDASDEAVATGLAARLIEEEVRRVGGGTG